MDNRSDLVKMSEQLLRIAEVKHTLHPIVSPVTLPKKYVSLLKSPSITPEHNTSSLSKATTAHQPTSARSFSAPEARRNSQLTRDSSLAAVTTGKKSTTMSDILPGSAHSDDGGCQLTDVHPQSSLSKLSKQLASAVSRSKSRSPKQHSSSESQVEKREQETRNKDVSNETKRNSKKKYIQRKPSDSNTRSSQTSQKRDVMQFIQEQEQSLQERFLSLPLKVNKRQRPLTPTLQQSAGLDHLDNLVRLMEQLTALKDENNKLRKRCDYLESTRTLLQTKRDISSYDMNSSLGFMTPPSNNKYDHNREIVVDSNVQPYEIKLKKPRKSKSEEFELSELTDSSSDEGLKQRKTSTLSRRFSTGSLAAQTDRGIEVVEVTSKKRNNGHSRRMKSKQKSKSSKWSRVKQALTGQKSHDDGRAKARKFRDKKRSSHYPSSENEHSPYDSRSAWYTVSESERDVLTTRRLPPNLKTTKPDQEDDDPDLTTEIWMGPPDWWEEYESRREGSCTSTNSQASSTIEITTMYLGSSKDTTTSTIKSRSSATPSTSQDKCLVTSSSLQPDQITSASSLAGATDDDTTSKEMYTRVQKRATLHKSSSGKSADFDLAGNMDLQTDKKSHKSAWGRVKDIIHTRKDSIKKKLKRDRPGIDHEEARDISIDALSENYTGHGCGPAHVVNKQKTKVGSESPPKKTGVSPKALQGATQGNVELAALLAGGVSEEFSKKMQEWEQLKSKKCSVTFRASADESELGSLEFPQEFPVHTIDLRDFKGKVPDNTSEIVTTEECNTSMEVLGAPSESVDEKGRQKGGSFSRRLQVDREEAKLEKERKKVERQRIHTLECEAKLEKLKDRLTQSETNGQRTENEGSSHSKQDDVWNSNTGKSKADEILKDTQAPTKDSPEDTTPLDETNSETSLEEDEATAAQNCLTKSNIASLERANTQLLENLHKKEIEYAAVQEEVRKVNEKLLKVRADHDAEMARFYSDLAKGMFAGPVKLEVGELEATVDQLEEKIKMMENFGEKLASSMESAAIGKWQSIEAEDTVHKQLLELIEEMRNMLIQAAQSKEHSEKTVALSNFETFYAQAMKLQVQMNNLRLSHLERNREIMVIKRQLLLQEVNNLLLQADITRKETELYQFQEAKIFGSVKRWNTFSGSDRQRPQARITSPVKTSTYLKAGTQKEVRPRQLETPLINIPYQSEEVTLARPTSSPSALPVPAEKADDSLTCLPAAVDEHSSKEATCDRFTKRIEIVRDQLPCRSATRGDNRLETDLTQRSAVAPIATSEQTTVSSPQFSEFANQVLSKKCPSEQSSAIPNETQNAPAYSLENSFKSASQNGSENDTVDETSLLNLTELNTESASKINTQEKKAESGFTTACDSVPLHNEIVELRRVKHEVEREAFPLKQKSSGDNATLTRKHENSSTGTLSAHVTPGQSSLQKPMLVDAWQSHDKHHPVTKYAQEAQAIEKSDLVIGIKRDEAEMADNKSQQVDKTVCNLQSPSYTNRVSSDLPPSSSNGRKIIPEQKDSKVQQLESCTASPRGSHVFMKGKPPLPRHVSPVRYSTPAFPSIEKGPRSKSVGDVDRTTPESITSKPLQEVLDKFGKRASVYDTNDPLFGVRKLPSPTLHLPRVGLVSRVRNIKPAAELLALRQRCVRGHTVAGTKILQKHSSTEDHTSERDNKKASSIEDDKKVGNVQTFSAREDHILVGDNQSVGSTNDCTPEGDNQKSSLTQDDIHEGDNPKVSSTDEQSLDEDKRKSSSTTDHMLEREEIQNKEHVSGTNDERLSRDTALEQGSGSFEVSSDLLLGRTEQIYSQTECVGHNNAHLLSQALPDIVNSSPPVNEPFCERPKTKLSNVFKDNTKSRCPVGSVCDSVHDKRDNISSTSDSTTQQHRQCDVVSPTFNLELNKSFSQPLIEDHGIQTQESVAMSTSHHVLPTLTSAGAKDQEKYCDDLSNGAGTSRDSMTNTKLNKDVALLSASAPASPSPQHAEVIRRSKWNSEKLSKETISSLASLPSPSPSKSRRSKRHNETIETLCKQTISAAISPALAETPFDTTSPVSMTSTRTMQSTVQPDTSSNQDDTKLLPDNMEAQASPPSPTPKEKVKSTRILDTTWLQKSKKFFNVSK